MQAAEYEYYSYFKYETVPQRKIRSINRMIQKYLGSSYSWDGELWYQGNPMSDTWQTETERKAIAKAERNWHEAISAH